MNQIYIRGNEIATKEYVDGLSLGGDSSALENYYTKEEVNNLIENSDGGNTDLSNYYTKEEINNVIAEINNTVQKEIMPDPSQDNVGTIIQYIGDTNEYYTNSHFYQVVEQTIINEDGTETTIYVWEEIVSPEADLSNYYTKEEINNIIAEANKSTQVEEMPEASADNKGTVIQYIGDTNNTYTTGYFYQVIEETVINEDGTETIIYKWEEIKSPEINLDEYATKKYVDDNIQPCSVYKAFAPDTQTIQINGDLVNNEVYKELLTGFIKKCIEENSFNKILHLGLGSSSHNGEYLAIVFDQCKKGSIQYGSVTSHEYIYYGRHMDAIGVSYSAPYESVYKLSIFVIDNETEDPVYSATISNQNISSLTKTNTWVYTPTGDYHPATKKYVDDLITTSIAGISTTSMEMATSLPTENISTSTIYLIKDEAASTDTENIYNEYIYVNGGWENIGSTKTTVDLSNYYTKEEAEAKIDEAIAGATGTDLSNYYTKEEINNKNYLTEIPSDYITQNELSNALKNIDGTIFNLGDITLNPSELEEGIYTWEGNTLATKTGTPASMLNIISAPTTVTIENGKAYFHDKNGDLYIYDYETGKIQIVNYATKQLAYTTDLESYSTTTEMNTTIETAIKNIEHPTTDLSNYYNKQEIDTMIGNINSILDAINGEEV